MSSTLKNVIWIVIDTLRADMLACCGSEIAERNEIDEILEQGVLFTDVMTSGGSTRISAPSYFTSLRPGLTGMTDHAVQAIRNFKDDAVTVTEHFRKYGYRTLRWDDSALDSCQPKPGFDVFEAGYPTLAHTPDQDYDNARRDAFIKCLREDDKPFFVNFHLDYIHDFGGIKAIEWTTEQYLEIVKGQAEDFKKLWDKLNPGPDDIVVVTSDHGCILDENYIEYDGKKPWAFSDSRTRVPASFIAEGLYPARKDALIRSMDIGPTLLDMAIGKKMHAQGVSLLPVLQGGPEMQLIGIAERNIGLAKKSITDYVCLREGGWAYILLHGEPHMLFNREDGEFTMDHLGKGLEVEKRLQKYYEDFIVNGAQTATEVYRQNGMSIAEVRGTPDISILLPVFEWNDETRLCVDSLLDQALFTELILLDGDRTGGVEQALKSDYGDRLYLHHIKVDDIPLRDMLNIGLEQARGAYTVTATPLCQYTENFCYALRQAFEQDQDTILAYPNLVRLLHDNRKMEYLGSDICFDDIVFSRLGCCLEHNASTASLSLPHFNEVGGCAMFRTETLRDMGGFVANKENFIEETWTSLSRHGSICHVQKGLVISKDLLKLRPAMPAYAKPSPLQVSVLVPLIQPDSFRLLIRTLAMLSEQQVTGLEVLLLHQQKDDIRIETVTKAFPTLSVRLVGESGPLHTLLNAGITSAQGKYLFWLDPADKILHNCIKTLLDAIPADNETGAIKCSFLISTPGAPVRLSTPHGDAHSILHSYCDLRGLFYKRALHTEVGGFKPAIKNEAGWEMSMRLALTAPFHIHEEPLIIASSGYHIFPKPSMDSYQRVILSMVEAMGGNVDFLRLYERDFRYHRPDIAQYILKEKMAVTLNHIRKHGIDAKMNLRIPTSIKIEKAAGAAKA